MGFLADRFAVISTYVAERMRYGVPETSGPVDREVLFLLDGVGGFQLCALTVRRALREEGSDLGTVLFKWQFGLPVDIWTDLMWLRRNRLMGIKLARKLLTFRRAHPGTRVHLLAFSGGAGIAVFACERLRRAAGLKPAELIDTLILACPALSPAYNLGSALRAVKRCYALVSHRDTLVLGLGTRLFGTMDRRFSPAAGLVGFRIPKDLSDDDTRAYERLGEIRWSPALRQDGHRGGHGGWAGAKFLRRHLLAMLRGKPRLPVHEVQPV